METPQPSNNELMKAVLIRDLNDKIIFWNFGCEILYGYSASEALGKVSHELLKTQFPCSLESIVDHLKLFRSWEGPLEHHRKDGVKVIVHSIWKFNPSKEIAIEELIGFAQEMIWIANKDGKLMFWSNEAENLIGYKSFEAMGKDENELLHVESKIPTKLITESLFGGGTNSWEGELSVITKCGVKKILNCKKHRYSVGDKDYVITYFRDISDIALDKESRMVFAEKLARAKRAEVLNASLLSLAHSWNNILASIIGISSFALATEDSQKGNALTTALVDIAVTAESAVQLTRSVISFCLPPKQEEKKEKKNSLIELNTLIKEMSWMIRFALGPMGFITLKLQDIPLVYSTFSDIQQILLNFSVNSRDAKAHKLIISTSLIDKSNIEIANEEDIQKSEQTKFVRLSFIDDGVGIPVDVLGKLFSFGFTTKESGSGSGIGLWTVLTCMKNCGGFCRARNVDGNGAEFLLYFRASEIFNPPAAHDALETVLPRNSYNLDLSKLPHGTETLLVVEDDPTVSRVITRMANSLGYKVFDAADGNSAIEQVKLHLSEIKLAVIDMTLPDTTGKDLSAMILKINPNIKCLFMSGLDLGVVHILVKPFTLSTFSQHIRQVLDHPTTPQPKEE